MIENRRPSAPWLALAVLALGLFMTLLDLTIVNVAIPSIVDDLHASLDQILWVLNGYSLMYAVLLITSGRLGTSSDRATCLPPGSWCSPSPQLSAGLPRTPRNSSWRAVPRGLARRSSHLRACPS